MTMQHARTKDDIAEKNIRLAFAHLEAILDDPALLDEIPDGATVIDIPDDDPELAAYNRALGAQREAEGRTVLYRQVTTSAPA